MWNLITDKLTDWLLQSVLVVGDNEYNFTCVEFEVPIEHQGEDTLLSAVWRSKDSIWFWNIDFYIFIS